jgi:hypothetical protein
MAHITRAIMTIITNTMNALAATHVMRSNIWLFPVMEDQIVARLVLTAQTLKSTEALYLCALDTPHLQ